MALVGRAHTVGQPVRVRAWPYRVRVLSRSAGRLAVQAFSSGFFPGEGGLV